jgi:hypothetical protein
MKRLFLTLALALPIYQEASASYVDPTTNYTYTWTCYNSDCNGGSAYIDQFKIYVRPDVSGVNYRAEQTSQYSTTGDALTLIGLYTNNLLSSFLTETGATITSSSGVDFSYNAAGDNSLPNHTAMFGSEDKASGQPALGLNEVNEWVNLNLQYVSGVTKTSFTTNAMFNANHYIYVHLQGTNGTWTNPDGSQGRSTSEKWKLTWVDTSNPGGGGTGDPVPEPSIVALMGIGLLGMGASRLRKTKV